MEQTLDVRGVNIGTEEPAAILMDAVLAKLSYALMCMPVNRLELLSPTQLPAYVSVERIETIGKMYIHLRSQLRSMWTGGTALVLGRENTFSPSSNFVTESEYIEYLSTENDNLEARVSELESRLEELQVYLPTIKKLVAEYKFATIRVESVVRDLAVKHGPRTGLEVARAQDVLAARPEELFHELE
jgi:hypothetical protein